MPSAALAVRITSRPHTTAVIAANSSPILRCRRATSGTPPRAVAGRGFASAPGRRSGSDSTAPAATTSKAPMAASSGGASPSRRKANSIVKIGKLQVTGTVRATPTRRNAITLQVSPTSPPTTMAATISRMRVGVKVDAPGAPAARNQTTSTAAPSSARSPLSTNGSSRWERWRNRMLVTLQHTA